MSDVISYQKSFEELEQIVKDLEQGDIPIDDLTSKVSRGAELIKICGDKLKTTENQINNVIKELTEASSDENLTENTEEKNQF